MLSSCRIAMATMVLSALPSCVQPMAQLDGTTMSTSTTTTTTATQSLPYPLRAGVENYCYPFRAKVEEYGHEAIGTGHVGRDEQGRVFISFFWRGDSSATDMGLQNVQDLRSERWQIEEDCGFLIFETKIEGSGMRLSSLIPIDFKPTDFGSENNMPQMVLIHAMDNLTAEANGTKWRREFHSEERNVIIIFGEGAPWSERPDDTFLFAEERENGEFYVNEIRLLEPYWQVHDRWTRDSMEVEEEQEIIEIRRPTKPR